MKPADVGPLVHKGRSATYEAIRRGEIPSITIGASVFVPTAALWRLFGLDPPETSEAGASTPALALANPAAATQKEHP